MIGPSGLPPTLVWALPVEPNVLAVEHEEMHPCRREKPQDVILPFGSMAVEDLSNNPKLRVDIERNNVNAFEPNVGAGRCSIKCLVVAILV